MFFLGEGLVDRAGGGNFVGALAVVVVDVEGGWAGGAEVVGEDGVTLVVPVEFLGFGAGLIAEDAKVEAGGRGRGLERGLDIRNFDAATVEEFEDEVVGVLEEEILEVGEIAVGDRGAGGDGGQLREERRREKGRRGEDEEGGEAGRLHGGRMKSDGGGVKSKCQRALKKGQRDREDGGNFHLSVERWDEIVGC